jgi:hypothetical protein
MAVSSQQPASRVVAHPQNRPTANAENPGFDGDLMECSAFYAGLLGGLFL